MAWVAAALAADPAAGAPPVVGKDVVSGEVPLGFLPWGSGSGLHVDQAGIQVTRGYVYVSVPKANDYTASFIAEAPEAGVIAVHFPFRDTMLKLWVHRAGDGGSPSVGRQGDKFPLSGWSVAHKLPLRPKDKVAFDLKVGRDDFEYTVDIPGFQFKAPRIAHRHAASVYQHELPPALARLTDAIVLEAQKIVVKDFRFTPNIGGR